MIVASSESPGSWTRHRSSLRIQQQASGRYKPVRIKAAGFDSFQNIRFTCSKCNITYVNDENAMDPIEYHTKNSPDCSFVRGFYHCEKFNVSCSEEKATSSEQEMVTKCGEIFNFAELNSMKSIRKRNFENWKSKKPSSTEMILAGFFQCYVRDRVICLYCNLICEGWTESDNPAEVHSVASPNCPYVQAVIVNGKKEERMILNDLKAESDYKLASTHIEKVSEVYPQFKTITQRVESFKNWKHTSAPSIIDMARSGFFYTNTNNIVTCFYCGGSLQNWSETDNPQIEHCRWFPSCTYAKHLAGSDLYARIEAAKKMQQTRNGAFQLGATQTTANPEDKTKIISRHAAATLDTTPCVFLLDCSVRLNVIRRVIEDRLKIHNDDFEQDVDLIIQGFILDRQISEINGRHEKILRPSTITKSTEDIGQSTTLSSLNPRIDAENSTCKHEKSNNNDDKLQDDSCIICFQEKRQLVCIPCGHLTTCVACGYSVDVCPICRVKVKAYVRVYI